MSDELQPISLDDLKDLSKGEIIKLPPWEGIDRPYVPVRVKHIDFTQHLMELENMPNQLMKAAQEVFEGKDPETDTPDEEKALAFLKENKEQLEEMKPVITAMAKEALVEPTYEDFEETMPLTFGQKMAIFQYVVSGVKQVEPFRKKSE